MKFFYVLFSWICCLSAVAGRRHGEKCKKCKVPKAPLKGKPLYLTLSCESDANTVLNALVSELTQGKDDLAPPLLFTTERVVDTTSDAQAYQVAADGSYANYTFPERTTSANLFVFAETETQVQAAVLYAQTCEYAVTVRSGGHSYLGMSASCHNAALNDDSKACMVIDVGLMKQQTIKQEDGTLVFGPGNRLEQVAQFLDDQSAIVDPDQNLFIPTGVCVGVAMGGHVQTGGFGLWGRQLGPLASRVLGFRIVLCNGAIQEVVTPDEDTSQLNDDLYYAVLGGASGSFGVVTEINIQPAIGLKSVFWQTTVVWEVEGIVKMFRKLGESTTANAQDTRWNFQFTAQGIAPLGRPNLLRMEASWVAPADEFDDYDASFFQDIVDACDGCIIVDNLVTTERPSSVLKDRHLLAKFGGYELPDPFRHYFKTFQQTNDYPDSDALEQLARKIDTVMPSSDSFYVFFIQPSYTMSGYNEHIALPFPGVKFGSTFDVFVPSPALIPAVKPIALDYATFLRQLFGEDNRMYWAAYEEGDGPINIENEVESYFDSVEKFELLQEIKACVDEENLFRNTMSILPAVKESKESSNNSISSSSSSSSNRSRVRRGKH